MKWHSNQFRQCLRAVVLLGLLLPGVGAQAQTDEAQQLLLNVEKLAQLKKILQTMYDGYQVLQQGYTAIQQRTEANFSLHRQFLDALMEVSPAVKKYYRVSEIISYQGRLVREYRQAWKAFRANPSFTGEEVQYIAKIYGNLVQESARCLDDLLMVLTAGRLRMSDAERLAAIDRIYKEVEGQLLFLRHFNNSTGRLAWQRAATQDEINRLRKWYYQP